MENTKINWKCSLSSETIQCGRSKHNTKKYDTGKAAVNAYNPDRNKTLQTRGREPSIPSEGGPAPATACWQNG